MTIPHSRTRAVLVPGILAFTCIAACGGGGRDAHGPERRLVQEQANLEAMKSTPPASGKDRQSLETKQEILRTQEMATKKATADFQSAEGLRIRGRAMLREAEGGVSLKLDVEGVPQGAKAIYVHQTADCSNLAQGSMGPGFSPEASSAGAEQNAGDLGNIVIARTGIGTLNVMIMGPNLTPGDPMSLLGRSLVIHDSRDRSSDDAADLGKPLACAPIKPR